MSSDMELEPAVRARGASPAAASGAPGAVADRAPRLRAIERDPSATTPAGLQRRRALTWRRLAMAAICAASVAAIGLGVATSLGADGWSALDIGIALAVVISAPPTVLSFWSAALGFVLRRIYADPESLVAPDATAPAQLAAPSGRLAVLMTLRNEDPRRALKRLIALREDLDRGDDAALYDVFVLSDTDDASVAAEEERLFAANHDRLAGAGRAEYRRRPENTGYKAGNMRDWVERWGAGYAFMAPLDADSLLSAAALRRLHGLAARRPRIGIVQAVGLGAPSTSGFARLQQFGARLGQRVFLTGASWWQGDCGPFWGHNAVVRVDAFKRWCKLPMLPGSPPLGGAILSHDQVEAALMRRGGYEVRLVPEALESFEETPVTLLDFLKRETRWANGNLQYGPLLGLARLRPTSRFQLAHAMALYIAPAAWMLMVALAAGKMIEPEWMRITEAEGSALGATIGVALFFVMMAASMAPKLFGALDVALERGGVRRFGGAGRFTLSFLMETLYSVLMAPIVAFRITVFVLGLPFGKKLNWGGQQRDAYRISFGDAARGLWPQTLAGAALTALILAVMPAVLPWAAPLILGLVLAIPFAVLTADPRFGAWLTKRGLAASPEELRETPILRAVETAALRETPRPSSLAAG